MIYQPHQTVVSQLVTRATEVTGIPRRCITGPSRFPQYCAVRWAIMYCAHNYGLSTNQIGKGLGDRDHSTILHGLRRANQLIRLDQDFRDLVNAIELRFEAREAA